MADWTLRQARYFLATVEHGSVAGGAAAEVVAQGTVSQAVAALEKSLGVDLLVHGPARRAVPTAAGRAFAAEVKEVLDAVDRATDVATDAATQLRGRLTVGCAQQLAARMFPPLAEHFTRVWPEVELVLAEGTPIHLQDGVREGRIDIALAYSRQAGDDLHLHRLAPVVPHAMLAADHPLVLSGHTTVRVGDLAGMRAVMPLLPPTEDLLMEALGDLGEQPEVAWRSSSAETVRGLVARGLAFSVVNSVPHTGEAFDGRQVAYLPLADALPKNAVVALTAPTSRRVRRVDEALAVLERIAQETA
ncbi:MAG: LysR family transcriptional regulator [Galactobacter sp.]